MSVKRFAIPIVLCSSVLAAPCLAQGPGAMDTAETPPQLVATYDTLADTILGAKQTEWNLIHSILATTYSHAAMTMDDAKAKIRAGDKAGAQIEKLAALVAQLGNEGDASVAAIRKRLVEAGHHHNAKGEEQGIYDEGFVIVTRVAKKTFLDAANAIGKMAGSPNVGALEAEWQKVQKQFKELHKDVPG